MLIGRMESNVKEQNDKYLEGINNMTDLSTSIMKLEEALISIQPAVQVRIR